MTVTITSASRRPAPLPDLECRPRRSRSAGRRLRSRAVEGYLAPTAAPSQAGRTGNRAAPSELPAALHGAIGGAVITAARRSAGLTRRALARRLAVPPATVRAWEDGICPLYRVTYGQLRQIAGVLAEAGARTGLDLGGLVLASQCDLLIAGMLDGSEDYAEVPPVDQDAEGAPAHGLLRWALTGHVPERYRPYARTGPLLGRAEVLRFLALARNLAAGDQASELAAYGAALVQLAAGQHTTAAGLPITWPGGTFGQHPGRAGHVAQAGVARQRPPPADRLPNRLRRTR